MSTLAVVDVTRRCAFTLAVSQTPPGEDATKAEEVYPSCWGPADHPVIVVSQ
jgi:hypothetical protein